MTVAGWASAAYLLAPVGLGIASLDLWRARGRGTRAPGVAGLLVVTLCALMLGSAMPCAGQGLEGADSALTRARRAADAWLALVDGSQYEASWDSAAAPFRAAVTRSVWQTSLSSARAPFGPIRGRTLLSAVYRTELPGVPPGEYVVMQYEAEVAGDRTIVETVTPMREPDGGWRVSGYYIRPR
jgi:hypothetical protein